MLPTDQRFLGFAREMVLSNYRRPATPYRLLFYLTKRCNCRCQICRIWKTSAGPELSTDEVQRIFRNAAPYLRWLHLSGGEIFLRDDIQTLIRTAVDDLSRLFILQFATNCTKPDSVIEACRTLAGSQVPKIIISLSIDGVGALHDEQRGVPGLFDQVIELFRRIKGSYRSRIEPYLGMTVTKSNAGRLAEMVEDLQRLSGVNRRDIHFNFYHQSDMYYQNEGSEVLSPEEAERIANYLNSPFPWWSLLQPSHFLEHRYRKLYPEYLRSRRSPMRCEAFSGSLSLDSEGYIYPCMSYQRSGGLIRDFDYRLDSVWNSPQIREIREAIEKGQCPQCWTPCEAFQTILTHTLPGHKK